APGARVARGDPARQLEETRIEDRLAVEDPSERLDPPRVDAGLVANAGDDADLAPPAEEDDGARAGFRAVQELRGDPVRELAADRTVQRDVRVARERRRRGRLGLRARERVGEEELSGRTLQ